MSYAESGSVSAEDIDLSEKAGALSEAEFAELVYRHRAKILTITGRLLWNQQRLTLALDGGGSWVLDGPTRLYRCVGQRITVEGTRFGFNGIDVTRFKPEGGDWPPLGWWARLRRSLSIYL